MSTALLHFKQAFGFNFLLSFDFGLIGGRIIVIIFHKRKMT